MLPALIHLWTLTLAAIDTHLFSCQFFPRGNPAHTLGCEGRLHFWVTLVSNFQSESVGELRNSDG